ncbi:MAG: hypothetical protein B7Y08_25365 [Rhodospirillales bacterium 24-66-33]|jgi:hypothetical protein|nr:MAG: hypothetical protein B7Y57_25495 [Rhodospirillales bacterium 35-66-84]OYZ91409.1 MAG: hypothetical protein B7Y08_25365 [Rhodospirillales bacterium 24-66-33]OZB26239.1 MAG: hypothetical protein B7X63_09875 [Rhodospirillales bacterium 39-66-50]
MANGLQAPVVRPILLFELEFSTVQYLWTGIGTLAWNAQNWLGLGNMLELSAVEETDSIEARGFMLKLSGAPPDQIELALEELQTRRYGIIRLGLLDASGAIVSTPKIMCRGRLDVGEIDDSNPEKPIISLQYENELIDLERAREWRYTDEHQKLLHDGDASLRYISRYADLVIYWGRG